MEQVYEPTQQGGSLTEDDENNQGMNTAAAVEVGIGSDAAALLAFVGSALDVTGANVFKYLDFIKVVATVQVHVMPLGVSSSRFQVSG